MSKHISVVVIFSLLSFISALNLTDSHIIQVPLTFLLSIFSFLFSLIIDLIGVEGRIEANLGKIRGVIRKPSGFPDWIKLCLGNAKSFDFRIGFCNSHGGGTSLGGRGRS